MEHSHEVLSLTFGPDGKTLLTGSKDGTARFWDVPSGEPLGPPLRHNDAIRFAAFAPDGQMALTRSGEGVKVQTHVWRQLPVPVQGSVEQVRLWVQTATGMELDDHGVFHMLNADTWRQRRDRLTQLGGPPLP